MRLTRSIAVFLIAVGQTGWMYVSANAQVFDAPLTPGRVEERVLAAGERHIFHVNLSAESFLHAVVDQRGIDVVVELAASDTTPLLRQDSPNGDFGPERVAFIANVSGAYRLTITSFAKPPAPAGRYELRVHALRHATSSDYEHANAEKVFADAERLRLQNTSSTRAQAKELFSAAAGQFEQLRLPYEQALALYAAGLTSLRGGQTYEALPFLTKAVPLFRDLQAPTYASALNALGGAHNLLGDPTEAAAHYRLALDYFRKTGATAGEGIARNNLGTIHAETANWQSALEEYRAALPLFQSLKDRNREALALLNIGVSYSGLGDQERAVEYLQQALSIRRQADDRVGQAEALTSLGLVEIRRRQPDRALEYLNQALVLREAIGDRRLQGLTMSVTGEAFLQLNEFSQASIFLERAFSLRESSGDRRGAASTLIHLSTLRERQNQPEQALESARAAAKIFEELNDRNSIGRALIVIARAEFALGRWSDAVRSAEQAAEALHEVRARVSSPDFRSSFSGRRHEVLQTQVDLLMRLADVSSNDEYVLRALQVNERGRAQGLLDVLAESNVDIRRGINPDLVERERQLAQAIGVKSERLMPLLVRDRNAVGTQTLLHEISNLEAEYEELRARIRKLSPGYAALTQPQPIEVDSIRRDILDAESQLIEYSLGDAGSYAWVVTREEVRAVRLGPRAHIEAAARDVYRLVTARGISRADETSVERRRRIAAADAALPDALRLLSNLVVAPLGDLSKAFRILLVADGALQYVPFGILPGSIDETGRPLLADHEIVSMPSASVLAIQREQAKTRRAPATSVAVIADPVFDRTDARLTYRRSAQETTARAAADSTRILEHLSRPAPTAKASSSAASVIPRLPFTRNEADAILAVAKGQKNFRAVDFAATKEAVLGGALKNHGIVHFATHGFLDTERPSLSSIVLSLVDQNGNARDGFLRAQELYNLELNADLVVLSACQTGLGKSIEGEGLIGLTRGLMYAGAQRVVVSLWNVSDRATATLMSRFYRDMLTNGKTPSAALRAAQLEVMNIKGWENPYYWAPFIMQGDWR